MEGAVPGAVLEVVSVAASAVGLDWMEGVALEAALEVVSVTATKAAVKQVVASRENFQMHRVKAHCFRAKGTLQPTLRRRLIIIRFPLDT